MAQIELKQVRSDIIGILNDEEVEEGVQVDGRTDLPEKRVGGDIWRLGTDIPRTSWNVRVGCNMDPVSCPVRRNEQCNAENFISSDGLLGVRYSGAMHCGNPPQKPKRYCRL